MTKPLPDGCIKKQKEIPSRRKFNFILENISIKDKIGHLFIGDIKFNEEAADKKFFCSMKSIRLFLKVKK